MRLNRVLAMLALAVATGIATIWVEGQNLRLEQKLAELHRQRELLTQEQNRLRLAVSRLAAPAKVMESAKDAEESLAPPAVPTGDGSRASLQPYLQR
jgi:cell division protein FtsL